MIMRLFAESYTAECESRAGGEPAVPSGIRMVQRPLPVAGVFKSTALVSWNATSAASPANTIMVFVDWSYTAVCPSRPVAVRNLKSLLQWGVPGAVETSDELTVWPRDRISPAGLIFVEVETEDCCA